MYICFTYCLIATYCSADLTPTSCILCGCERLKDHTNDGDTKFCECPSSVGCAACEDDIQAREEDSGKFGVHYKCKVHGAYRHYEDGLWQYKVMAV